MPLPKVVKAYSVAYYNVAASSHGDDLRVIPTRATRMIYRSVLPG